jgi:hypothetical protein
MRLVYNNSSNKFRGRNASDDFSVSAYNTTEVLTPAYTVIDDTSYDITFDFNSTAITNNTQNISVTKPSSLTNHITNITSLSPSDVTIDSSGTTHCINEGTFPIQVSLPNIGTKIVNVTQTKNSNISTSTHTYKHFTTNSLAKHILDTVVTITAGKNPGSTAQNAYSVCNWIDSFTRSTSHLLYGYCDLTAIVAPINYSNEWGVNGNPTGCSSITLVSPQHTVTARHYHPGDNTPVIFVDNNNVQYHRTIVSSAFLDLPYQAVWDPVTNTPDLTLSQNRISGRTYRCSRDGTTTLDYTSSWKQGDYAVCVNSIWTRLIYSTDIATDFVVQLLDSPLPSNIKFMKVLPSNYINYLPTLTQGLSFDTNSNTLSLDGTSRYHKSVNKYLPNAYYDTVCRFFNSPFNLSSVNFGIPAFKHFHTSSKLTIDNCIEFNNLHSEFRLLNNAAFSYPDGSKWSEIGGYGSSSPAFLVINNEPVVLGCLHSIFVDNHYQLPNIANFHDDINTLMATLTSDAIVAGKIASNSLTYTLTDVDLSMFTNYHIV